MRSFPVGLALALLLPAVTSAQIRTPVVGFVALGIEPLTATDYASQVSTRSFTPGFNAAAGLRLHPLDSPWTWELRASLIWRSTSPQEACFWSACNFTSAFTTYGLQLGTQHQLRSTGWWRPYVGVGVGAFYARDRRPAHLCFSSDPACRSTQSIHAGVSPVATALLGAELGTGYPRFYVEAAYTRLWTSEPVRQLLPIQVGLRF